MAGIPTDSPSRNDTFFLLRMGARPWHGSKVGPYLGRQAQTPAIRTPFAGSSGSAAMHNRDGCARRQAPSRTKQRLGLSLHRGNCAVRRLDSTTKPEGDRASTTVIEMGCTHPARSIVFSDQYRKLRERFCVFGRERRRTDWKSAETRAHSRER